MASQDYHISETIKSVLEPYLSAHAEIRKQEIAELKSYIANEISSLKNWTTGEIDALKKQFSDFQTNIETTLATKAFIPIGLICSWPVATNPLDWYNSEGIQAWFDCNGQTFNTNVYPDLYRVLGTNRIPDYRGLFLRGHGSQTHIQNNGSLIGNTQTVHTSGQLGQIQGDAIRNIYGEVQAATIEERTDIFSRTTGCCYINQIYDFGQGGGREKDYGFGLNASRIVPTANENRPVNTAVRFIIRAIA